MTEADEVRAGSLILKDLRLFNSTAVFFEERVDPAIHTAISEEVATWLKSHALWYGEHEDLEKLWVAPPDWRTPDKEDVWSAWFQFGRRNSTESSSYLTADIFGAGEIDCGFRFEVDPASFGGRRAWNNYVGTLGEVAQQLSAQGWVHEGRGVFFQALTLPADLLASAWENEDWADALAPLNEALDGLVKALPIFGAIVEGAKPKGE